MAGKKGGSSMVSERERIEQEQEEKLHVRIDKIFEDESMKLKALASANIGDFAVHGIKVYEGDKGLFVSMPSTSYKDANGETKYEDVFHPTTAEARTKLCGAVAEAYKQELEQKQADVQQSTPTNNTELVQKM